MLATTAPNSLVMNPTSMLVEMKSFIPSSYTFETEIQKIKQELLQGDLDCSAKDETNEEYLYEMQDIIDHLPKLPEIQQQKLTIPEFDEIEVKATDSVEIKKFIRKVNYEFLETIRITEKVTKHQKQGGGLNFYYLYYFTIFI
ncbi:hypothetical protein TVAG_455350 [Trichomonas vaginalis G3]|uniref:Uncharacterized protein n=1 Tax=Trichomonas vaginalis (strain ATCC PRA-98 / G3) TaxID=412133 RepID=A2GFC6_TRIV3|nr:hypothetical protein TVAG_455350 [Trichomonas vaginalis G3]|eukprot:XP_001297073.1 hypothetical protein [Trichomonas vaginalis G3]